MKILLKLLEFYFILSYLIMQAETFVKFKNAYQLAIEDSIGQIGGIEVDLNGNLVVFHRADREYSNEFVDSFFATFLVYTIKIFVFL